MNSTHPYYMPALNSLIAAQGTRLSNFLVSTGVCCPARASVLTGKLAHCTNVTGNSFPAGGWTKFRKNGLDRSTLATWLTDAGYSTYLVGKMMNGYSQYNGKGNTDKYCTPGWTGIDALTLGTYELYNSCFSTDCGDDECFPNQYQTDIITNKTVSNIRKAVAAKKPFFMYVTPTAPHVDNSGKGWQPPPPAARHANLYANDKWIQIPKGANYARPNPDIPSSGDFVTSQYDPEMEYMYLQRLRSLRAVDEMITAVVNELSAQGVLDNTYIMFSSDNGYHLGQFGLKDGKALYIEEDVRVPFYIRGPGIPKNVVTPYQGNLIDIAPTIMALADLPLKPDFDGLPLPMGTALQGAHVALLADATTGGFGAPLPITPQLIASWRRDSNILEAWDSDGNAKTSGVVYKAVRVCSTYKVFPDSGTAPGGLAAQAVYAPGTGLSCYVYVKWCQGARGFYDLSSDPYEVNNRVNDAPSRVLDRFDGIMSALTHCKGSQCRSPYGQLHPGFNVQDFNQAMDPKWDAMYSSLIKFAFKKCTWTYQPDQEPTWTQGLGPQPQFNAQ